MSLTTKIFAVIILICLARSARSPFGLKIFDETPKAKAFANESDVITTIQNLVESDSKWVFNVGRKYLNNATQALAEKYEAETFLRSLFDELGDDDSIVSHPEMMKCVNLDEALLKSTRNVVKLFKKYNSYAKFGTFEEFNNKYLVPYHEFSNALKENIRKTCSGKQKIEEMLYSFDLKIILENEHIAKNWEKMEYDVRNILGSLESNIGKENGLALTLKFLKANFGLTK